MSGVEISQWAALKRQRGGRNGQEGQPAPLYRASWSKMSFNLSRSNGMKVLPDFGLSNLSPYLLLKIYMEFTE